VSLDDRPDLLDFLCEVRPHLHIPRLVVRVG
jgi:hypothetical protein